ncbi:MAG TPA: cyanophycin synthetase, partial [Polyangiaceae bacterium]|nr:cyanophycin synthetase [Polyangiaceae bacterium]
VRIERPGAAPLEVDSPLLGFPGAYALTAATALVESLLARPIDRTEITRALTSPELGEAGRLGTIELPDGSLLIDDTYNASPASMRSSVAVARELAALRRSRLVLALGEMRELGALSETAHREIGQDLALGNSELLIAFGGHARLFLAGLRNASERCWFVDDALRALELLRRERQPGDVILIKASNGLGAKRIVEGLRGG